MTVFEVNTTCLSVVKWFGGRVGELLLLRLGWKIELLQVRSRSRRHQHNVPWWAGTP